MSRKLIDAEKLKKHYAWWEDDERRTLFDQIVDAQPTIDAISVSFIEEQVKLCNEIGFRRGEESYVALIEKWREKNGTETY